MGFQDVPEAHMVMVSKSGALASLPCELSSTYPWMLSLEGTIEISCTDQIVPGWHTLQCRVQGTPYLFTFQSRGRGLIVDILIDGRRPASPRPGCHNEL